MRRAVLIVPILALVASACGSNPPAQPPPTGSTAPVKLAGPVTNHGTKAVPGAKPSITIEVEDDFFEPTFLKLDPGATVSLKLENKGIHSHTFTIQGLRIDQILAPGESKTLAFTLPAEPGANFVCKFHQPNGMQGAFFYTEGATFSSAPGSPSPTPEASTPDGDGGYNY